MKLSRRIRHTGVGLIWRASPVVLIVAAGLALASAWLLVSPGLRQDYSIESMVARDDPEYKRYRHFLKTFVSNEIAVIAVKSEQPLSPEALALIHDVQAKCATLDGVQRVTAISELPGLLAGVASPRPLYELIAEDETRRTVALDRLRDEPLIIDNMLSRDGTTIAVVCQMLQTTPTRGNRAAVDQMRRIVADARTEHPTMGIILAGPAVTMIDLFDYIHRDLVLFSFVVAGLMAVALAVIFRDIRIVFIALGAAACATLITLGASIVTGVAMSLVTQVIVILGSILAVANIVHVLVYWQEQTKVRGRTDRRRAAVATLSRMIAPTAAASTTTALGFAALGVSALVPFQDFARLMCVAISVGWIVGLSAVRLLKPGGVRAAAAAPEHSPLLNRALQLAASLSGRHALPVTVVTLIVLAVFGAGILRIRYESDFLRNFRQSTDIRRSYAFIEKNLAPVGSMEIVMQSADGGPILTPDALARARQLTQTVVQQEASIPKANSLADLLTTGGTDLPTSPLMLRMRLGVIETLFGADTVRNFVSPDRSAMRINFRALEGIQVSEKLALVDRVRERAAAVFGPDYAVQSTGLYPFYASLVAGLLRDQNVSFIVAVVTIFVCISLFTGRLALGAVALVPNLVPIALTMGFMGWQGIAVNMATAMILAVSIGIAVDDAIHYTWRFRREMRHRRDPLQALRIAHTTTGQACVFTTVVIVFGFWILCLSEFLPTAYFGGLIGITMLGALLADLLVFPMLLLRVERRRVVGIVDGR